MKYDIPGYIGLFFAGVNFVAVGDAITQIISVVSAGVCALSILIAWGVRIYKIVKKWIDKKITAEEAVNELSKISEEIKNHDTDTDK